MVAVAVLRSGSTGIDLVIQLLDVTVLVLVAHRIRPVVIDMVGNISYWLKIIKGTTFIIMHLPI